MLFFEKLQRLALRGLKTNIDLIALWVFYIALQPLIPVDNILARPDLIPWLMFCLSGALFLRGKRYGDGPHISLTQTKSIAGRILQRIVMVATPLILAFWYDLGAALHLRQEVSFVGTALTPAALTVLALIFLRLSVSHGKTAWNPPGLPSWLIWSLGLVLGVGSAVFLGYAAHNRYPIPTEAFLLGVAFLCSGAVVGRVQNLRQRLASGSKDGGPYSPSVFNFLFSSVGSTFGLWALFQIQELLGLGKDVSFEQAFVPAAFIVAWAAVVWPKRVPIAVTCVLHEIMPAGGGDKTISTTATPYYQPPEGALRIDPLRIKRVRSIHPWLVQVKASRVPEFDDPIKPLWAYRQPPQSFHLLGNAAFEPDPVTNQEQWNEITIRLKGSEDVGAVSSGAASNKKLVVLKPFLKPGLLGRFRRNSVTTFRWDESVPEGTVQTVDATTESLSIEDGSIIVFATEGVARAFEVEIGAPVYTFVEAARFRPPQIEDYVKV